MPFTIVRQDITQMDVDAIVNAANTELAMGGGVCGAIFRAAGPSELQASCNRLAPIQTGKAVITPGFGLPAKYVIHTAGPVYRDGTQGEEQLLRSSYQNSLTLARENGCQSIAFPLISSGIYGYPKQEALTVATDAIRDFLDEHDMDVYLTVFDKASFAVSEKLLGDVKSYIDERFVDARYDEGREISRPLLEVEQESIAPPARASILKRKRTSRKAHREKEDTSPLLWKVSEDTAPMPEQAMQVRESAVPDDIEGWIGKIDEPFSDTLLRLIDEKGKTDAQVYRRANIDRRLFSKIRTGRDYTPGKRTIIALAVALELSISETTDLLKRAGYALSPSRLFDVIVEYFIVNGKYDIYEINEVLFHHDQPLLGA